MTKILLVEDDKSLSQNLSGILEGKGYTVEVCADGEEALYWLETREFAAAILDWELPGLSGVEILSRYRKGGGTIPILMLTGRKTTSDKVTGFDSGADDYLAKPFDPPELLARLRALLRRAPELRPDVLIVGDIELDTSSCTVTREGTVIKLGTKEYALLELFMRNVGRLFSAEVLIEKLWTADSELTEVSVRSHIARLRSKLEESCGGKPVPIKNVYGMGYKLEQF
ncbi:MAG: response regulator transcription factor [Candidatus Obscuribacterales bacterium]|nr:response regulator transcription factor [Candidatus Obscuribacterales bacterium]